MIDGGPGRGAVLRPLASANRTRFTPRARAVYLVVVAVVLALLVRLAFIQLADGAYYAREAASEVRYHVAVPSIRGAIYDRNGQVLAISSPTSLVVADDFQVAHPSLEAAALAGFLPLTRGRLAKLLHRHSGYVVLDPDLSVVAGNTLSAQQFPGISVEPSSVRTDPDGTIAESVLGRVNAAGQGDAGLEYEYQSTLAGTEGEEIVTASPNRVDLPGSQVTTVTKAVPGEGLELTIDTPLQFVAEEDLAHQLRATDATSGVALVMDVKTGQLLASVSEVNTDEPAGVLGPIPGWGQSVGVAGVQATINNLGFTEVYEPGSVFKLVPFSAALDAGLITPQTTVTVPYSVRVDGRTFHDADWHPTETLTATDVLARSSNIGTYEITRRLGEAALLAQVQRLGFGAPTAINFPGESAGLLVNAQSWSGSDLAALPIGQVDAVTPIQVLDAYNAVANGGTFVEPSLVRATVSPTGELTDVGPSASHRVFSSAVAATLTKMLEQVVIDGTGVLAEIPGYQIAGKTGTSQIPTPGQASYIAGAYDATFVGFAPANHPVLSMLVMVQRPRTTIYGGAVAAPVFQSVMRYALHHYGIPATGPTKVVSRSSAAVSSDVT